MAVSGSTIAGLLLALAADGLPIEGVRRIPIPEKGGDAYGRLSSGVIDSQAKLDKLLAGVKAEAAWDEAHRHRFLKAIADAKVDFSKEVLVLIGHVEGSGSVRVRLRLTAEPGGWLRAAISRRVPEDQTADMAHYGFALAVRRDRAKRIEVWTQADVLPIPDR